MFRRGLATLLVLSAAGCGGGAAERGAEAPPLRTAASHCPKDLLPLGANPVAKAARAALRREDRRNRPQVIGAAIATVDFSRATQVVHDCGRDVAARSVVVEVHRRAFDRGPNKSASLAQGVYVVGRFADGWRVWEVLH